MSLLVRFFAYKVRCRAQVRGGFAAPLESRPSRRRNIGQKQPSRLTCRTPSKGTFGSALDKAEENDRNNRRSAGSSRKSARETLPFGLSLMAD